MAPSPFPERRSLAGDEPDLGRAQAPDRRTAAATAAVLLVVSALIAVLVGGPLRPPAPVYRAGDVARADVKATRDFPVPDVAATEARQKAAEAAAPAVYDRDPGALEEALARLRADLDSAVPDPVGENGPLPLDARAVARALETRWKAPVAPEQALELATGPGRRRFVAAVRSVLGPLYRRGVVANRKLLQGDRPVRIRDLLGGGERPLDDPRSLEDFEEVRRGLGGAVGAGALPRAVAAALLRPNVALNIQETADRRARAREAVPPVLYLIRQGEILVREGDRVTQQQARRLEVHAALAGPAGAWRTRAGVFVVLALVLAGVQRFGASNVKKFRSVGRDGLFLAVLLVVAVAVEKAGLVAAAGLAEAFPGPFSATVAFALPLAAAPMVVRAVLNSETAFLFAVPYALVAALPFDQRPMALVVVLIGAVVGIHSVGRAARRLDFIAAGLWIGLAQGAVVVGYGAVGGGLAGPEAAWAVLWAVAGGLGSSFVALSAVSLAEWAFGYTTEIRLLELASLDHPLLRELMLRAPGTYHHAIVTGSLVKAAGEAIGARALLATVAAYYHDVGKLSKPAYYVENQADGRNLHDKLSPSMSSLILTSHVKEGVDLAHRYRLGRDIADIIQQHHGTSLIRYFYDKARQQARAGVEAVEEPAYRYPGPKPQSREAALVLLADAVEAASRTVPDPRPARIRGMVQNIINRTFTDGQLDECDLTLRDLHRIARSFSRILAAIYHQRIDYPVGAHKDRRADGDLDPKRPSGRRDRRGSADAPGQDRLRRLGL